MTWQDQALCARPQFKNLPGWDPDEMTETYTKEGRRYQLRRVQLVCAACPVQAECHQAAQDWHVTAGVWAGQRYFDATRRLRAEA